MRKVIGLIVGIYSALLASEEQLADSGVLVGLDVQLINTESNYKLSNSGNIVYHFDNTDKQLVPTLKLGYQFYSMRSYVSYYFQKESYSEYSLDHHSLGANIEYFPRLFTHKDVDFFLAVGLEIGYINTRMYNLNSTLSSNHNGLGLKLSDNFHQHNLDWGPNIAIVVAMKNAFSLEAGFRYRDVDVIENAYESSEENLQSIKKQYYLGVNYLF